MRVIAGKFKGRSLKPPKGLDVRPTADRVKESMFRIFGTRVIDAHFLDLCAGTGNVGIEALSQGAESVTFVERSRQCLHIIESNLDRCGLNRQHPQVQLLQLDARKGLIHLGTRQAKFNLIYFDPPYDASIYIPCLTLISQYGLLADSGLITVEHHKAKAADERMQTVVGGLIQVRQKIYGDTALSFYEWEKRP